jgi:Fe-S cluster assembly protein SufD
VVARAHRIAIRAARLSEDIPFAPTPEVLSEILEVLDELGWDGGGVVAPAVRRAALAAFAGFGCERGAFPPRWRHDYGALSFELLSWSTGRMRLPPTPPRPQTPPGQKTPARPDASESGEPHDAPALAVDNAGGIVHLGSTYLEAPVQRGDARVTLMSLADAWRTDAQRIDAIRGRIVAPHADRFTALATAFANCGAFIGIPAGHAVETPLQLVWTARPGPAQAVFSHTAVHVGAHARATVIERHLGSSEAFVDGIVEIELETGAHLDYVVVQDADESTRLFFRRAARCAPGATIGWHVANLGGSLVRESTLTELGGRAASAHVNAFFFARGFGHVDSHALLDHRGPQTKSRTIVRNVASGRGQGRSSGVIRIARSAHEADASLRNDALVLSRDAHLEATPALEIDTNDVRAFHAATVGSLDEEQLFYVQTRGIARGRAERMIALAFFEPAIAGFPGDALRDEVRTGLDAHLDDVPETFS